MTKKRKLVMWAFVALMWLYLLVESHGVMRIGAAVLLAVSIAVPILDASFTRAAERKQQDKVQSKTDAAKM